MSAVKTVSVHVTGRVQGVWFRAWTRQQAQALGLTGWVRNEADGSVRAHLEGLADAVDDMLKRLWQGPDLSEVSAVEANPAPPLGLPDFTIRH